YENFGRADAIIAFPDADPVHLLTLLAEAEVGHPLIQQKSQCSKITSPADIHRKPIIFYGATEEWKSFRRQLSEMESQGLTRQSFDHHVHYSESVTELEAFLHENLPEQIPSTRLHYYAHTKKGSELFLDVDEDVRPPAFITVSFFGSASTRRKDHLERTDAAARMCARKGWNILHGGGDGGVMKQLSVSGSKAKAYVLGISVDGSGAPVITFERDLKSGRPSDIDHFVESKDMLHRIETYAGHSEAFVALDGGIGSLQEVYVIAELLSKNHPVVTYETADGDRVPKPLFLVNEGGIYTPVLEYLKERGLDYLQEQMQVVESLDELQRGLEKAFQHHPPLPKDIREKGRFRDRYFDVIHPTTQRLLREPDFKRKLPAL
ncbi:MAG: LOG family protein, partial [Bdellovibrionales bacterium]|nr:LOG family protein [Bdellovibrionales bacterium]